jgi:serine/threonine-protein kinase
MGSVWVAQHLTLDTPVAVKFMLNVSVKSGSGDSSLGSGPSNGLEKAPPSSGSIATRGRFEFEAKMAAQIRSANVVQVLDYGVDHGTPYIAMELLHGEDLGAYLKRKPRLPLEEVSHLVVAIARALQRAHDVGLVHRDLKPPNIFLAREGDEVVPKVLDFGVAKTVTDRPVAEKTMEGTLVGTPWYMAPEQAMARGGVDHRADVWSLGVIVYRAITGVRPFESESLLELVVQICSQSPLPPSRRVQGLPPAVDAWMARALERDPDKRFQSAREMAKALVAIAAPRSSLHPPGKSARPAAVSEEPEMPTVIAPPETPAALAVAAPAPPTEVPAEAPRSKRTIVLLAAMLGLGVIGAVLIFVATHHQSEKQTSVPTTSASTGAAPFPSSLLAVAPVVTAETSAAASSARPAPSAAPSAAPSTSASANAAAKPFHPKKAVDCSTPFYWDKNGTKFIKPECL